MLKVRAFNISWVSFHPVCWCMTAKESDNTVKSSTAAFALRNHLPWWFVIAGLIGLLVYFLKDGQAFPNASLDLKVPRSEIIARAAEWSKRLGYETPGSITSTTFEWDSNAKTFLELEFGAARANELMKDEVPVWHWCTRFCREFKWQEMKIYLNPAGQLVAFSRILENDLPLPSVSHEQAQQMAGAFVEKQAGVSLQGYKLVNDESVSRAARTDHSFSWEQQTDLLGAKQRISARVSGNIVTGFNHFLHVPESWENKFKTIRSYNSLLGQIASVFYYLLNFVGVFFFFRAVATHNIRWKLAFSIGLVLGIGAVFTRLNNMAQMFDGYQTNQSVQAFLTNYVTETALSACGVAVVSACFIAAAESFYRVHYPHKLAVENFFRIKGIATSEFATGMWVGYAGTGMALGWVVSYYLLGERVGFWCPLGVTNYEILSSTFPFYSAICLGVYASLTEEILYRVYALTLLQKLVGNFWVANLLQAAAWGFMHSTYPQQPAYARGVELTCTGLVFGWMMRRYGVLPCLVTHYLLDAFLDSQALMRSSIPALQFSALIPVVPLMVVAIGSTFLAMRRSVPDQAASNEAIAKPTAPSHEHASWHDLPPFAYEPFSRKLRAGLAVAILAALPLGLILRSAPAVGDGFQVRISRDRAIKNADAIMLRHGHPSGGYMVCAWLDDQISAVEMQYLFEKLGLPKTRELSLVAETGLMWRVRYFKPQQQDEYEVQMDGGGKEVSFDITKAEEEPAKHISAEQAKKMADEYIAYVAPQFHDRKFENVSQSEKPARIDYAFNYEVPSLKVGDAKFKLSSSVLGDQVSNFGDGWELPDQWKWERSKKTSRDEICGQLKKFLTLIISLASLWWAFGMLRTGSVRWRPAALLAIPVALLVIPVELNDLPMLFRYYTTITPINSFAWQQVLDLLRSMMTKFVETLLTGAFALAAFRMLFPSTNILSLLKTTFKPDPDQRGAQRNVWTDAVVAAYALVLCDWLIDCAGFAIQDQFSPGVPMKYLSNVCANANVFSSTIEYACGALSRGLREVLQIALVAGVYVKYIGAHWMFFLFSAVQNVIQNSDQRYWQDIVVQSITGFLSAVLYWFFVMRIAKKNALAYFLAGYVALLFRKIPYLIEHAFPCYGLSLVLLVVLTLLPVMYLLYLVLRPVSQVLEPVLPDQESIVAEQHLDVREQEALVTEQHPDVPEQDSQ